MGSGIVRLGDISHPLYACLYPRVAWSELINSSIGEVSLGKPEIEKHILQLRRQLMSINPGNELQSNWLFPVSDVFVPGKMSSKPCNWSIARTFVASSSWPSLGPRSAICRRLWRATVDIGGGLAGWVVNLSFLLHPDHPRQSQTIPDHPRPKLALCGSFMTWLRLTHFVFLPV